METFTLWISVISAICIGIMALAIFFALLNSVRRRFLKTAIIKLKGLFDVSKPLNVYINSGKSISNVKFIGFTDPDSMKGVPHQLNNMVVFENADGNRILLRPETIRMIEEINPNNTLQRREQDGTSNGG